MIGRERLRNLPLPHDDEGNAVGQAPTLIGSVVIKANGFVNAHFRGADDHESLVLPETFDEWLETHAGRRSGQHVAQFDQDEIRRDDAPVRT